MTLEEKVKALEKDVERLTKRNKLLTKRVDKLQEENTKLVEELETLDALQDHSGIETLCPQCGKELVIFDLPNGNIKQYLCKNYPDCNYKRRE